VSASRVAWVVVGGYPLIPPEDWTMPRQRRHFTAQEKVAILQHRLLGKTHLPALCAQFDIDPKLFYRWQKELFANGQAAFDRTAERLTDLGGVEGRRLDALEEQFRRTEEELSILMEEHVRLKSRVWGPLTGVWVAQGVRDTVVDFVSSWSRRTGIPVGRFVGWLGITVSKFHDWKRRYGRANEHNASVPRDHWLGEQEKRTILDYHARHPRESYRRLAARMHEAGLVGISPSSVYRVLKEARVL
jgi:putative transposase